MTEEAAQVDDNMPPEEVIPEATIEATPESAPAVEEPGKEPAAEPEADGVQKRINKVTADKHAERRRAEKAEARIAELEASQTPAERPEPQLSDPDIDFDEGKLNIALSKYHGEKAATEAVSNYKTQQDGITAENRQNEINQKFDEKVVEFRKTNTDYDQVIGDLPQLPSDVMDEIMQHENGPQLAHYLGKHLDVAENITLMKLGQISAQLANVKPTKQPSAAPDPIDPVKAGGSLNKSQEDMSMDEIYALE